MAFRLDVVALFVRMRQSKIQICAVIRISQGFSNLALIDIHT